MADVTIVAATTGTVRGMRNIVFTSATVGYCFYLSGTTTFAYVKTTDGGGTWGSAVTIQSATTNIAFDVWFDKWTPGDSGTLIHMWYFDSTNDIVFYRTLDTSSDTLGTQRSAFVGASAVAGRGAFCSGTKTRSGYLYCAFDIDAGAEKGLVRSTDSGTTWGTNLSSAFVQNTLDQCLLFPASGTGDDNDMWCVMQSAGTDSVFMKMWDSSVPIAAQGTVMQSMIENATDLLGQLGFSGSIRHSDGHLIVAIFSERDTATADLTVWDVASVVDGLDGTRTQKTNITTDIDDIYYPAVFIDQNTNAIYVAYNGKRDGSEVLDTSTKIYYTKSTDGGTTWSAGDTAVMEGTATNVRRVCVPLSGSLFYVNWFSSSAASLLGNKVNSVNVTPVITLPQFTLQPLQPPHYRSRPARQLFRK